jgi:hypothetical protein
MREEELEPSPWYARAVAAARRHAGIAVFVVSAAVLAWGWASADREGAYPWTILLYPAAVAGAVGLFVVRKWHAWLVFMLLGVLVGTVSALQLYLGPAFAGEFNVGLLTMLVFAVLGFILGALAEAIRGLHRVTHGLLERLPPPKK